MFDYLWNVGGLVIQVVGRLDRTEWLLVFAGVLIVGLFCMRGYGSRSTY